MFGDQAANVGSNPQPKTRKPHRKSRNGCVPCKARHVKCDEKRPACINCDKYGSKCEYPKPKRSASSDAAASPGDTSPRAIETPSSTQTLGSHQPNAASSCKQNPDISLNIPQLRLLHHFTTVTTKTLAYKPGSHDIFSSYLVKVAFDYPFLLHAILALSALHLSRLDPSLRADHVLQAQQHHQVAVAQFRTEVKNIDDSNFTPVLAFASTLFPYSWAICIDNSDNLEHAFDSVLANLFLTRGVRPMVQEGGLYETMVKSELGRLIPKDVHELNWGTAEPPEDTELLQLRKFSDAVHHIYPPDIIEAYKEAIRILEVLYAAISTASQPASDSLLKVWVHYLQPRFIELLSEKQPGALIIFAHYAVLLGRRRDCWYLEGIDELILNIADKLIPTEWRYWLDWPKEQIRGGQALPVAVT